MNPTKTRSRLRWLGALPVLLIVLFAGFLAWRVHGRETQLRKNAITTSATVVDVDVANDPDTLWVRLNDCGCVVAVATNNVRAHPVGSQLPVRHERYAPGHVEALVDAPNPYAPLLPMVGGLAL
ncbi:MAG: hypothetical protein QOJ00_371, partial [Actinomycetota bacterium]